VSEHAWDLSDTPLPIETAVPITPLSKRRLHNMSAIDGVVKGRLAHNPPVRSGRSIDARQAPIVPIHQATLAEGVAGQRATV